jgi:hypothetical protein
MDTLIKQRRSKLAPFQETLFQMEAATNTLAEMQSWLAAQGITISTVAISKFLACRRRRRWREELLGKIAGAARPAEEARAALQTNPAPELDTLIKLSRILVFEQTSQLVTTPELNRQARETTKMVLNYINRQSRLVSKEKIAPLAERTAALRQAAAHEKTLTAILAQIKENPALLELFRTTCAGIPADLSPQQTGTTPGANPE